MKSLRTRNKPDEAKKINRQNAEIALSKDTRGGKKARGKRQGSSKRIVKEEGKSKQMHAVRAARKLVSLIPLFWLYQLYFSL